MTQDRIFCPLKSKWFDLVKARRKTWEFRDSKSPVARQISKKGSFSPPWPIPIELRKGYNGESLRGIILEIRLYYTPDCVEYEVLRDACLTRADLHEIMSRGHLVAIRFELEGG